MARMYYSKDVTKYQFVDVKYIPTNEKGHTLETCKREDYLAFTKLEVEAFILQCKELILSKYKKNLLVYKLETLHINGETKRFMRIGYQPALPESVEQFKVVSTPFTNWSPSALRYLGQRNYQFL